LGGAIVWELIIIPAFFHRSRQILAARRNGSSVLSSDPSLGESSRHLKIDAEVVAIPVAVAFGYGIPTFLILTLDTPSVILVWLFFPVLVSAVRQVVRAGLWLLRARGGSVHFESYRAALAVMYAGPVVCSVAAHAFLIWSLVAGADDRREMTRSTLKFIEVDVAFIAATVLYWLFVEAGWRVAVVMVATSIVLGPGAGLCVGWIWRESFINDEPHVTVVAVGSQEDDIEGEASEETPLL
jgi:hypothetical protein